MIGKAIYNILSNDSDVSAVVSTKIYPAQAVEDIAYPYITFEQSSTEFSDTKDGKSTLDTVDFDISIWSEDLVELNDLALKVRNALDRYSGTNSGLEIQSVHFIAEDWDYTDDNRIFLKMQTYKFRYLTIYSTLSRPTNLAIATTSDTVLDLTWNDNATGETGYEVWRSSAVETGYSLITTTSANATSYQNTGLTADTQYYYKIRPTDGTNGGEWSLIVGGRTDNTTATSGIVYFRPMLTGQTTSYRTGDDAWHLANGTYDITHPTTPASYADLDNDATNVFETLASNNAFGNTNRFTDSVGGQDYDGTGGSINNYAIDHHTGLGWYMLAITTADWDDQIDDAYNNTYATFSDWRLTNNNEFASIMNRKPLEGLTYTPFSGITENTFTTSTTQPDSTGNCYRWDIDTNGGRLLFAAKTLTRAALICRNHY